MLHLLQSALVMPLLNPGNGSPCLACQHASAIFQNRFKVSFETFVNKWLPTSSDLESSTDESDK
jgi:hypothetical protein